ncbi:MAG: inner membrane CreD family protein [Verrucomicrobia bacterium]|nr:inner membrane CreD family protein [Verrucomicrobiota bacterium]MCG2680526.1 inner membrane CreD family protein [Kiritimatiellia bacterium]MBU4248249.1 inner membrane CreD family protein [Verrucomicrobiota bacterium]MBU4290452.1 inner membrane CreD family protein [Verrucomicrobiota bacterium]MBU4428584.1 inner membrane CreD family protein [Verrucomicrobiota bacterium]
MSIKRIVAIGLIFVLSCAGWWILGLATAARSTAFFRQLGNKVEVLWGVPLCQEAPALSVQVPGSDQVRWIMPLKNEIMVALKTDYRKKGLMWYPTYNCSFEGSYLITNQESVAQKVRLHFDFPAKSGTYDNFSLVVGGKPASAPIDTKAGVGEIIELQPGESREFKVTYQTRGIREWRYRTDRNVGRVQNLDLTVTTSFRDVDFTDGSLSPMSKEETAGGMTLKWSATDLITAQDIGIVIPEKLNPGPVTSRITFFAPVCLLFFFILIATISIMGGISIHPMHYLFVAAGFFAFHLLLSYLVGLLDIQLAFVISAATSVALVTSYLAAALGKSFPWKTAAAGQIFYLVLFSYSFFFTGITGLTVAIGSVATLAVLMRVTARVEWSNVFKSSRKLAASPTPPPFP